MNLTIGILHCGDMGSALAKCLIKGGYRVITTCSGRSSRTEEQARAAGVELLPELGDVFDQSDIIFSIIIPSAAPELARKYADFRRQHSGDGIFVETNSIDLDTLKQIQTLMETHGIDFVDAAIHGTADRLEDLGVLYTSGQKGNYIESVCRNSLHVQYLGEDIGLAKKLKLIMSGVSKSLSAMFLELAILAERANMYKPFMQSCSRFYPGIITAIERMLPTYPRHAARRVLEIEDIEDMARMYNLKLGLTHEAGSLIKSLSDMDWSRLGSKSRDPVYDIIRTMEENR